MNRYAVIGLLSFSTWTVAQDGNGEASRLKYTGPTDQAIYAAEEQAGKMTSAEVFKELQKLEAAQAAKIASTGNWIDVNPTTMALSSVLEKRRNKGQPDGSFYFAVHKWKYCTLLQQQSSKVFADQAAECWGETMEAFKVASAAGIGDASFNIGRQFENGYGVIASKLAAADWYLKAAEQHNKVKDRDQALTAVEAALEAVPSHPKAIRLRNAMMK